MKKISPRLKIIISVAVIVVLVLVFYLITNTISKLTGKVIGNSNYDDFAKCLTEKGVKMYGAFWCGHCQNTKANFGTSWQYVTYIECDPRGENSQTDLCISMGIEGYPTWEIDNKLYPGEMSLQELGKLSGCKLN